MTKTTKSKLADMSDERIAELQNFKTKNYNDCPIQTQEQLKEFKPKYPDARLYKPIKRTVQIRLDADVLEWLKQAGAGYQTRANAILRQAMLQAD
ncbi:MAG: BrnA antitoxin family protein [Treponema sp.]|nr:BrnA antitoxin family protein [Treponema sp.]